MVPRQPCAVVPCTVDPHRLVRSFEASFGSAFLYRMQDVGSRRTLLADISGAWRITADGRVQRPGEVYEGRIDDLVEDCFRAAEEGPSGWAPDVGFVLAYDLTWRLHAESGRPGPSDAPADDRLLGVVGPLTHRVVHDQRTSALWCDAADEAVVRAVVEAAEAAGELDDDDGGALTDVLEPVDAARYTAQVARVHQHLARGDAYQVLVSVPVRVRPRADAYDYFAQVVRRYGEAEYAYWVSVDGVRVFGTCALPHLEVRGDGLSTRVFAGTRPASRSDAERDAQGHVLRTDVRYRAEHVMLVDLERNDLSTVSVPGTVAVGPFLEPVGIGPTTYLASDVTSRAAPGTHPARLVLANFPRGVTTGAPKHRVQLILHDLEQGARGFYTGTVGTYDARRRDVRSNVVVTCGQQDGEDVVLRCGGGIVADSTAEQELAELDLKLKFLV